MKNFNWPTRLLLLLALTYTQVGYSQTKQKWITVYSDDFSGAHYDFEPGRYDNRYLLESGFGQINSIKVPAGMKAVLYSEDNFKGNVLVLTEDGHTPFLKAKGFANVLLNISLVVEEYTAPATTEPVVTIYKDSFSGASKTLAPGDYQPFELGAVGNDQLSSVKIPRGMTVTLYENEGFQGKSLVLKQDASAGFLVSNNFNDITSSIKVDAAPPPAPVVVTPAPTVVTPTPVVAPPAVVVPTVVAPVVMATPSPDPTSVTIYQGDYTGSSKSLGVGRYGFDALGIGNDELSSIKVPNGFRVTLYENEGFEGRSLVLTKDARADFLVANNFNNLTSSIIVEALPVVTIYQGNYSGASKTFVPGRYEMDALGIGNDQLSSIKVPSGFRVTLFERAAFEGRALILTQDTDNELLRQYSFDKITSSLVVAELEKPLLMVTLFTDNFAGQSKSLAPGQYEYQAFGIGNNTLSSIKIPRGLRVTLYEFGAQEGRTMVLTSDTGTDFFSANSFDDITTSLNIEPIPEAELVVTVYRDRFAGPFHALTPGKYNAVDLAVGNNQITSVKVPKGMRAILFDENNFTGTSVTLEANSDFSNNPSFNDRASSMIIEDVVAPIVTPLVIVPPVVAPVIVAPVVTPTTVPPAPAVVTTPPCQMTSSQFTNAVKAVEAKGFQEEKMATARITTKDKCLSNDQIRRMAQLFSFEDQSLEFVKYAYNLSTEKSEYYTLEDLFKFMSTKDAFTKFLSGK